MRSHLTNSSEPMNLSTSDCLDSEADPRKARMDLFAGSVDYTTRAFHTLDAGQTPLSASVCRAPVVPLFAPPGEDRVGHAVPSPPHPSISTSQANYRRAGDIIGAAASGGLSHNKRRARRKTSLIDYTARDSPRAGTLFLPLTGIAAAAPYSGPEAQDPSRLIAEWQARIADSVAAPDAKIPNVIEHVNPDPTSSDFHWNAGDSDSKEHLVTRVTTWRDEVANNFVAPLHGTSTPPFENDASITPCETATSQKVEHWLQGLTDWQTNCQNRSSEGQSSSQAR